MTSLIRKHRGILSLLLVLVLGLTASAAFWLSMSRLPHPREANRDRLFRWLVLRDLQAEPIEIQVALVDRLQLELAANPDVATDEALGEQHQRQLQSNVDVLQRVWFESRCRRYAAAAPSNRLAYLREQIELVEVWSGIENSFGDDVGSGETASSRLFGQIAAWIELASGDAQQQMSTAVHDAVVCWLAIRDLNDYPQDTRADLAARVIGQLQADSVGEFPFPLDETQRARLAANSELLMEAHLLAQTDVYFATAEADRVKFVDGQIDHVMNHGLPQWLAWLSNDTPQKPASTTATLMLFMAKVDTWIDRAAPDQQPRLRQFVDQIKQRMIWRQFQNALPTSSR